MKEIWLAYDLPPASPSCDLLTLAAITSLGEGRTGTEGGVGRALLSPFCLCLSRRLSLADKPLCIIEYNRGLP